MNFNVTYKLLWRMYMDEVTVGKELVRQLTNKEQHIQVIERILLDADAELKASDERVKELEKQLETVVAFLSIAKNYLP